MRETPEAAQGGKIRSGQQGGQQPDQRVAARGSEGVAMCEESNRSGHPAAWAAPAGDPAKDAQRANGVRCQAPAHHTVVADACCRSCCDKNAAGQGRALRAAL